MVNGKPGDHPYTSIVWYGDDLGKPEIAGIVRRLDPLGDERIRALVSDLLMFMLQLPDMQYWRVRLLDHLAAILELTAADSGKPDS